MTRLTRRTALATATAAASVALPRFAIGQADNRPTITIAVQKISNTNTLSALREQSNVGTRIAPTITERLIDLNYQSKLEPVPGLATEWKRISDTTVEFKLRQGVKLHDGGEMTAEDVAGSFSPQHMFGDTRPTVRGVTIPLSGSNPAVFTKELSRDVPPIARRLWPAFERMEIVDKHTVRLVNAAPDVTIEGRASVRGSDIVGIKAFNEAPSWLDYARKPVGTGPYKVREFKADTSLVLDAHDEYWGGRPPIKTLRFVEVPEASSRINGLLAGEFHFAGDISPDQIQQIESNPVFDVQRGLVPNHRLIVFDKNHAPLRDPRVRRAMTHAIDRQAIVDALWAGRTVIPRGLQWDFYADMLVADWTVPKYDPALARQMIKDAGYKGDPITFRVLNNYYINQTATSQVLTEMWKQVGLNVQIQMVENWTQIFARGPERGVRDWSNSATFSDPVSSIVAQHGPNGQQQQMGEWTDDEMNKLSVELESSTDRARRKQVFARMLQICEREDPAYTVLHQNAVFTAKRKEIKWKAAPSFAMDFRAHNWG
ncbi:MAG: ABC transporter substrate-binding protein [Acetobacteraceae bacterium]|nr:ABC transporter substrate-binding protein [Acetobacteraceae bacterium]